MSENVREMTVGYLHSSIASCGRMLIVCYAYNVAPDNRLVLQSVGTRGRNVWQFYSLENKLFGCNKTALIAVRGQING